MEGYTLQSMDSARVKMEVIIVIIIIIIIVTMIIFALKGAVRDSFLISSLLRELSPTRTLKWQRHSRVQTTCNTSSAYQQAVCHPVRRDSSAVQFYGVSIVLILLAGPLTHEGGEETGTHGENA